MTPVNNQNIIYNERAAIEEVARVDAEQPIINKKNSKWNKRLGILLTALCVVVFAVSLYVFGKNGPLSCNIVYLPIMLIMMIAIWLSINAYEEFSKIVLPPYEWYSANAEYYRITKGYTPLKHTLIPEDNGDVTLHVEMEDNNHIVFDDFVLFPQLRKITKTDIAQITVDLPNGVVYIPYKP